MWHWVWRGGTASVHFSNIVSHVNLEVKMRTDADNHSSILHGINMGLKCFVIGSVKPLYQNTHQLWSKSQLPCSFICLLSCLLTSCLSWPFEWMYIQHLASRESDNITWLKESRNPQAVTEDTLDTRVNSRKGKLQTAVPCVFWERLMEILLRHP